MNRRDFLRVSGAAGGALALNPVISEWIFPPDTAGLVPAGPGLESWVSTTCLMCPGGCGLRVRCVDGFPVSISGNANHPVNAGGLCTEGMASLQWLYHPDRILTPLVRTAEERSKPFQPATWDQALERISQTLKSLRLKNQPQKLGFVLGRTGGSMEALVRHFMTTWGSPHLFIDEPQDGCEQVMEAMHGLRVRPAFDFNSTALVLSFGADLLDAWQAPLQFQRSFAGFRAPARISTAQLIVADVRLSRTAARAQQWVGIAPGSYGALALGIAYLMLREKLYDTDFVAANLSGFEDSIEDSGRPRLGFRTLVLRDYSPEVVSRLTGIAVEKILALGKTFAESPTAVAVFDENVTAMPGGLFAGMAIHSLNLLKGNLNRPGGVYLQPEVPLKLLAANRPASTDRTSRRLMVEDLAELPAGDSLEVLFLYHSNPVFSSPSGKSLETALSKIPLVVSLSPLRDECSSYADICLPDATYLERWEDRLFPAASPISGWSVVQPATPPAGQSRPTGDVLLELARRLGSPMAEAFPWKTFEEVLKYRAEGLHKARAGTLCQDPFQQGLVGEMESRGWWFPEPASFDEFWKKMLEAGAWLDPNYQVRTLHDYSGHDDGKVDLHSRRLLARQQNSTKTISDIECLPHYHADEAGPPAAEYPMTLIPYRLGKLGGGTNGALPWVLQRGGLLQKTSWNSWVELHPRDAQKLGISNLDWVWVESPNGRIKVRALLFPGTGQGIVNIPSSLGHREMGRWAKERGVNPLRLLGGRRDPITGIAYRFGTRVKLYKA